MIRYLYLSLFCATIIISSCKNNRVTGQSEDKLPDDSIAAQITKQINEQPENARLFESRAKRFLEIKDHEAALKDINAAIRLDPREVNFQVTLSDIYFSMGRARDCRTTLEQAASSHPGSKEPLLKLAELNMYFGQNDKAENYLKEAEAIDANDHRVYLMRGFMYKHAGDTINAIRNFLKVTEYKPDHFDAYINLGVIYAARKDPLAIEFYRNAHMVDSTRIEPLYNLGMYYQSVGDFNSAILAYTDLFELEPSNKQALYNMGYIHVELQIWSEAITYFNRAINLDPNYLEGYYARAYCFEQMGDVLNATTDYQKCLELQPGYTPALEGLGRIKSGENDLRSLPENQ